MSLDAGVSRKDWEKKALLPAQELLQEQYLETCASIDKLNQHMKEYKGLIARLQTLADEVSHPVMVPIGSIAFMPGKLIHTNEVKVLLGENYFAETSTKHAREIAHRRVEFLEEEIKRFEKQKAEIAFQYEQVTDIKRESKGDDEDVVDIQEPYTEEDEESDRRAYPHLFNREHATEPSPALEIAKVDVPRTEVTKHEEQSSKQPGSFDESKKKKRHRKKKKGHASKSQSNIEDNDASDENVDQDSASHEDTEQTADQIVPEEPSSPQVSMKVRFSDVALGKTGGLVAQENPHPILRVPPKSPTELAAYLARMKDRYQRASGDKSPDYLPMYNPSAYEEKVAENSPTLTAQTNQAIADVVVERNVPILAPSVMEGAQAAEESPAPVEKKVSKFKAQRQKK